MNTVFASASALLATGFIDKFADDHLDLVLGRIGKETGVRVDRGTDRLIITGKWSWILESHDILLEEFRNISEFRNNFEQNSSVENLPHTHSDSLAEGYNEHAIPGSDDPCHQSGHSDQYVATEQIVSGYMKMISDQFNLSGSKNEARINNNMPGTCTHEQDNAYCDIKVENETYTKMENYDDGDDTDDYMDNFTDLKATNAVSQKNSKSKETKTRKHKQNISNNSSDQKYDLSDIVKLEPYVHEEKEFSSGNEITAGTLIAKASKRNDNISTDLQCNECNFVGKDKISLSAHTKRCHVRKFSCNQCKSSFGFNKDLTRHKKQAHGGKGTPDCKDEISEQVTKRGRKKRPRIKDPDEVYPCDKCSYVGKEKVLLREHRRRLHSIRFHCDQCDKSFGYNKDLNRHKRNVHCMAEYQCAECKKLFKTPRSLNVHSKCHEVGYDKQAFACQVCDKRYSTKYVLDYHVKSEHMGMKKSFICPICGKSFTQKGSYRQHANVHAGFRPYVCDVCGKSFSYENALKAHKYLHDDVRRFQCSICDKRFLHKNSLRIHRNVHRESHDYMCTQCGQSFTQKQSLVRHERIHSGDKPYLCTICQKSFRDASIIRRHMILMHKKDPKKWQEDMVNNTSRAPNYYVEVLGSGNDLPPEIKEPDIDTAVQNVDNKSITLKESPDKNSSALSIDYTASLLAESIIANLQKD